MWPTTHLEHRAPARRGEARHGPRTRPPSCQPGSCSTAPKGTVMQPSHKKPRNASSIPDATTTEDRGEAGCMTKHLEHHYFAGLDLTGKRVVVVGAGTVAQRRVPRLIN
ncbi:NAD(P)-dependent oxidoreductase [Saccharopolyspora kobensis]|uniref:NAD(P)-dependent oxidoreductase n=1 Tax=Saccharopolyspora kobensis TaxID=146035 RepID=UPI003D9DC371